MRNQVGIRAGRALLSVERSAVGCELGRTIGAVVLSHW
jgi:hypothetical protein